MGHCLFMRKGETHTAPISGILASDLAVGSSVYLMENGVATEYLVVNQGKPSGSSLYDDSCDGTWLLRKDIKENRQWHSSDVNDYKNSTIHAWLNGDFYNQLGAVEQSVIKQVKIPYRAGSGNSKTVTNGNNGLSTKVFLLSSTELSFNHEKMPINEGAELSFFEGCSDTDIDEKRSAILNGSYSIWWTRSPSCTTQSVGKVTLHVTGNGTYSSPQCTKENGIRPAVILPSNVMFDKNTLILKGVA